MPTLRPTSAKASASAAATISILVVVVLSTTASMMMTVLRLTFIVLIAHRMLFFLLRLCGWMIATRVLACPGFSTWYSTIFLKPAMK